jgi:predicted helicase
VIHFYEDFLKEYDAEQRKKLGAFYTPLPVVRFIIRAVDSILEKDFGLTQGLANTSKIEVTSLVQNKKVKEQVHRVQILDPATGTGTFLNEVVRAIHGKFINQAGRWNSYVDDDLLPRIYGFELMMAPYTIAHLKLGMTLADTGYKSFNHRLGIYLTNSLEEAHANDGSLFSLGLSQSIAEEAIKASQIKNEKPIMVVIGNPPYSAVSSNKSANHLVEKYKVEPGGKERLKERKNWLDDDYVKFISFAENLLAKNGEGVLAYITNNGFIDNPTFRGMRWHLLNTFDDIYVVDLHGNAKKKETAEDGGKDENVFNIMQGVSINIFIKKSQKDKKALGKIHQIDLYGKREDKFDFLNKNSINTITWNEIEPSLPNLFFVSKGNVRDQGDYDQGFFIASHTGRHDGLFVKNSCGVVTMGDSFVVDSDKDVLVKRISDFISNDISAINLKTKYELGKNYAQWVVDNKEKISLDTGKIIRYSYRPFDDRFTVFDKNLVWRLREDVMKDISANKYSMVFEKIAANKSQPVGIYMTKDVIDCHLTGGQSYLGNLYSIGEDNNVVSNLNPVIVEKIEGIVGKTMPETIIDYIYAILHSPSYRDKYKEFLKIDFPRVPYPTDKKSFTALSVLGKELRELHLMESTRLNNLTTTYPESGNDTVDGKYPKYKDGKVFINASQYFGNVPDVAWSYYIGGHQPAQKWLKDRKSKKLSSKDIEHYQKIITALVETVRIMGEIDKIITL